ncbi:MAG TPA: hypothetical protein VN806_12725 [Caulobacteraceae bacterium]|nr:hypothetical protein [Caulobacteraceae bacterium]
MATHGSAGAAAAEAAGPADDDEAGAAAAAAELGAPDADWANATPPNAAPAITMANANAANR